LFTIVDNLKNDVEQGNRKKYHAAKGSVKHAILRPQEVQRKKLVISRMERIRKEMCLEWPNRW